MGVGGHLLGMGMENEWQIAVTFSSAARRGDDGPDGKSESTT